MSSFSTTPPAPSSTHIEDGRLERNPPNGPSPPFFNTEDITDKKLLNDLRVSAFNYLARREHSKEELKEKILQKFFSKDSSISKDQIQNLLDKVLEKIRQEDLQSDSRYASMFLRGRVQQGYGFLRITQEMKQKKISAEIFEQTLIENPQDWYQLALRAREKKFGSMVPKEPKERARQMRFLQYRGYSSDQIHHALNEY